MKYVVIVLGVLVLALAGSTYWLYSDVTELSASLADTTTSLNTAKSDVEYLKSSRQTDQEVTLNLAAQIKQIKEDGYATQKKLSEYANRKDVVLAKPGLVEIKINKATEKAQRDLYCASGGTCK